MPDTLSWDPINLEFKPPQRYVWDSSANGGSGGWVEPQKQWVWDSSANSGAGAWVVVYEAVLPAPTNLTINFAFESGQPTFTLDWTDNSNTEDEFRVYRSTNSGAFSKQGTTAESVTTYKDINVSANNNYDYYVVAWEEIAGESAQSNTVSGHFPADPSNLDTTSVSSTSITLQWDDNSINEGFWDIDRWDSTNGWIGIAQPSTTDEPGTTTDSYIDGTVSAGVEYDYRVAAIGSGDAQAQSLSTELQGTVEAVDPPADPTNLVASDAADASTEIDLTWDSNSSDEDSFEVHVDDGAGFVKWVTVTTSGTATNPRDYTVTGLTPDTTYDLKLRECNDGGCSGFSNTVTHTTSAGFVGELVPDADLETLAEFEDSTGGDGDGALWDEVDDPLDFSGADFIRADNNNSQYVKFRLSDDPQARNINPSATHTLSVIVRDQTTNSSGNASANVELGIGDGTTTLEASDTLFVLGNTSFQEYTYTLTSTERDNLIDYVDLVFWLRAQGFEDTGDRVLMDISSVRLLVGTPADPSNCIVSAVSNSELQITWADNSNNEDGFIIERCTGSGCSGFSQIDTVGRGVTSYNDTGLSGGTTYRYRVKATNAIGDSGYSNEDEATTNENIPTPPSGCTATTISSSQIDVTWTDNSSNEDDFEVFRDGVKVHTTTGANVTSWSDTGLNPNTTYTYKVRACNTGGCSSFSNTDSATTNQTTPAAPSGCTATTNTSVSITVSWTDNSNNEDDFEIYKDGALDTTVGANVESDVITGLTEGTQYAFKVRACNTAGCSAFSNTSSAYTKLATPGSFSVSTVSESQVDLSWVDQSNNEQNYEIYRDGSLHDTIAAGSTSYSDTGLTANTQYCYKVRAVHSTQPNSDFTSEKCATTLEDVDNPTSLAALDFSHCEGTPPFEFPAYEVSVQWTDNKATGQTVTHVEIWRKQGSGGTWVELDTVSFAGDGNSNSYLDDGSGHGEGAPQGGNTWFYRARNQFSDSSHSSYSNEDDVFVAVINC